MGAYLSWTVGAQINHVYFDAVMSEDHSLTAMVTEHPVEQGVNVTDHVRPNVAKVSIEGFISNAPLPTASNGMRHQTITLDLPTVPIGFSINSVVNAGVGAIKKLFGKGPVTSTWVWALTNGVDLVGQALEVLNSLKDTATFVTLVAPNRMYQNMIVEGVTMTRNTQDGTGARFKVDLREIRVVKSSLTAAPVAAIVRANKPQATGNQAPVTPTPTQQGHDGFLFTGISDAYKGLVPVP